MEIDLKKLYQAESITLDNDIIFNLEDYNNKDILSLDNMHVTGSIKYNSLENIELNLKLTGNMMLVDSITLEPINYPINVDISEEYPLDDNFFKEYCKNNQNTLDIMSILWENIVLEVPISLTHNHDLELSGDGWKLGNSKDINNNIDPRLAKLTKLLEEGKE